MTVGIAIAIVGDMGVWFVVCVCKSRLCSREFRPESARQTEAVV